MIKTISKLTRQSGVVLVVSLIMLLLLTLAGLAGSQVTSLEEKMASNSRDKNLAFQAAEVALRGGEVQIKNTVALTAFNGTYGLLGEDDIQSDFSLSSTWTSSNSIEFDTGIDSHLVATHPRYIIKYLTTDEPDTGASINVGGYGDSSAGAAVSYFMITTRGTGAQTTSQVYLRSYFGKRF